ncbi:hypothetical protein M0R45_030395 [Rubus argutus]|uniref:Uncharacterized protein n=1 Tax=Rubus argutus TaxID=59490 RepID=A0AAW1WF32_RUBAR
MVAAKGNNGGRCEARWNEAERAEGLRADEDAWSELDGNWFDDVVAKEWRRGAAMSLEVMTVVRCCVW